jgi:multidrug transporter EmrE-like cation transporter
MRFYAAGFSTYMVGLVCLIETFKNKNMAVATSIIVIVNIFTLTLVSRFAYHEEISIHKMIGIFFAMLAIYFLES